MKYYDTVKDESVDIVFFGFDENARPDLSDIGLFYVSDKSIIPVYNVFTHYVEYSGITCIGPECFRVFSSKNFTVEELPQQLSVIYSKASDLFSGVFSALDLKRSRPIASITEAQALGQTPDPADVDRLGQLNMIVEENRAILAELKSTTIPAGATLEQAQAIVIAASEVKPWLPAGYEELAHV